MKKLKRKKFKVIMIILTVAMMMFQSVSVYASATDVVTFADSNIESAVRVELGQPSGDITQADMLGVKSLTISHGTITTFTDLQYATNLNSFTIKNCTINTDFSTFSSFTKFQSLYLQNDTLVSLNGVPSSLTSLNVYTSQLSDLSPLVSCTNIKNMVIQGNKISDLSAVSSLTKLTYLSFENNNITDISPLAGLTELKHLDLDKNNISDLSPLSNLTNLTELDLTKNNISDITPLSNLTKLVYLGLTNTNTETPDNKITDVSALANNLSNCSSLYLYGNKIPNYNALANIGNNPSYTNTIYNTMEGNLNAATIHGTAWLTVRYVNESNIDIADPVNNTYNFANTLNSINVTSDTFTAPELENYILTDSTTSQAVTFDKTDLIKTIVFHYKQTASTTPTTVTTPPSVTVTPSESHKHHSEEPEEIKGSYIVQYKDQDTGELLEAETKKYDLDLGSYTEKAKDFKNYYLNDDKTKTIILTESNPKQTIVFNYKEMGSFKIRFIDESDNSLIIPEVDKKNFPLDTYVENAVYFDGYKLDDQETKKVTLDKNHLNGVIEFKYTKVKAPAPMPEELPKTGDNSKTITSIIILLLTALSLLFLICSKRTLNKK